ncbi:MAG: ABC-2 transporter permease [Oscillospiraceae bacterium]|nr:ABC-2 transporter permease [Oscillospiraceae bacterium]MDD6502399.1 ABC-2 transporter permease [Oscillospiraceae bacterium]
MSALLLKDLYMIKRDCRGNVILCLVFAVAGIAGNSIFFAIWPLLFCALIPSTLLGLEEQAGWQAYADTMPWSRKTVVTEKYVLTLSLSVCVTAVLTVVYALTGALGRTGIGPGDLLIVGIFVLGMLPASFMLPVTFKFGMVKGRTAYMVCLMVMGALLGILSSLSGEVTDFLTAGPQTLLLALLIAIPTVLFAASWVLAVKFYEAREL